VGAGLGIEKRNFSGLDYPGFFKIRPDPMINQRERNVSSRWQGLIPTGVRPFPNIF